jgi:osmotically-inducible protein OsmY
VLSRKQRKVLRLLASNDVLSNAAAERGRPGYAFDDDAITLRVATALQDERSLAAPSLRVATEDRVVRLTGAVCSQSRIDTAARIAGAIGGVESVRNDLRLLPH